MVLSHGEGVKGGLGRELPGKQIGGLKTERVQYSPYTDGDGWFWFIGTHRQIHMEVILDSKEEWY